jgi:hypothetical protein
MGVVPQFLSNLDRIDPKPRPSGRLIAGAVDLAMMNPAQRDGEFVADFATKRSRLHETEVMGIRMFAPAHQAGLFGHKPQMVFAAIAARFSERQSTLAISTDCGRVSGHGLRPG